MTQAFEEPANVVFPPSSYCTKTLSDLMKKMSSGDRGYRGLKNYSVMSLPMKKIFIFKFSCDFGVYPLLVVDINKQHAFWSNEDGRGGPKCLALVNGLHVVCIRKDPESNRYMVLDTTAVELPKSSANLVRFLNTAQVR